MHFIFLMSLLSLPDLDSYQPDMEELDRVFESLQAETEDLDRHLSSSSSLKRKPKQQGKPPSSSSSVTYAAVHKSAGSSQTSAPVSNGVHYSSDRESSPQPPLPPTSPDASRITGYVPQDRKGLAKKFGAFTFGLPTGEQQPCTAKRAVECLTREVRDK